ncbi:immunoglobulin superfamily member 5 isoform X2 [Parambassis ranga]|uniref:immunoglobulin superfamily member 5 isoform X2 n=1 Tax=Parambassis ranga TaxID=210632 RepID=UPI0010420E95|nr:immunoglobulin superfamily member 5 isoform X2 [Parambassis ranga]
MDILPLLVLLLSCRIEARAHVELSPATLTVLRGDEARFTCTARTRWTVMVWQLGGIPALTISKEDGVLPSVHSNVTAEKPPNSNGDSWTFILKNTQRHNQGQVTCDLQGIDRRTARLFVQEKGGVRVFGDDRLAFKGHSVQFKCEAAGWYPQPTLQWRVDDKQVSQSEYDIRSEELEESLFTVTSNLNVTAAKSFYVDCLASVSALTTPLKSSVRLTVVAEVVEEEHDCTVPLAITGSLAALLLLTLLCICTVLCYRQRRQEESPQEAIRFDQPVFGKSPYAEVTRGTINLGYTSEGPTDAVYNEQIMEARSQMDFVSFCKVPDVVSSSSLSLHSNSQPEQSSTSVRRITTV